MGPSFHFSEPPEGMCPECEGLGRVTDLDLEELVGPSRQKTLNEGAIRVPGYTPDGWYVRISRGGRRKRRDCCRRALDVPRGQADSV